MTEQLGYHTSILPLHQMAAHEVRTPLAIIMSYVQLLKQQTYGPLTREQLVALNKIEHQSRRLKELLNNELMALESEVAF